MKQSKSSQNQNQENNPVLDKYMSSLKSEDYSGSFERVRNWLEETDINLKSNKERKLISMKSYLLHNKRRLVYAFIFLLLVAAACNMPVTQQENLGNVISWSVDKSNSNTIEQINKLPWMSTLAGAKINTRCSELSGVTINRLFPSRALRNFGRGL